MTASSRGGMLEGLPPNDATHLLRFTCDETRARAAADMVMEVFDPAQIAAASFEDPAGGADPKPWLVEIFFGPGVDEDRIRELIADAFGEALAATVATEAVAEQDWVRRSLDGLAAVRAGRFVIHGGHDRGAARPNDHALEIEAALAFGTGHHGTTRGCLLALGDVLKRRRPRRVADLGTGTGVLAMAAALATKRDVFCGDLDPVAVRAARDNAALNGVGRWVRPVVAAGLAHPRLRRNGPYDLILANILARPLRMLAPSVAAHAAPGAELILSGLLPRDVPGILSRYGAQGFALAHRRDLEGWVTLRCLRRSLA